MQKNTIELDHELKAVILNVIIRHGVATQAWFKRRILHAPNQILILVDSNEYVRLIWFKRRIVLPNKIADASDVF